MLPYNRKLRERARELRTGMTDAEQRLWSRLRRKQVLGIQFYRQKPIGDFIVDFYAPRTGLVVEVDGSQHFEKAQMRRDQERDAILSNMGLEILRFDNLQVLKEIGGVVEMIFQTIERRIRGQNPP